MANVEQHKMFNDDFTTKTVNPGLAMTETLEAK